MVLTTDEMEVIVKIYFEKSIVFLTCDQFASLQLYLLLQKMIKSRVVVLQMSPK